MIHSFDNKCWNLILSFSNQNYIHIGWIKTPSLQIGQNYLRAICGFDVRHPTIERALLEWICVHDLFCMKVSVKGLSTGNSRQKQGISQKSLYAFTLKSKGVFTCSILARIMTIFVSIVARLTSIEPILEKCVHLQVQYSLVISQ